VRGDGQSLPTLAPRNPRPSRFHDFALPVWRGARLVPRWAVIGVVAWVVPAMTGQDGWDSWPGTPYPRAYGVYMNCYWR
jgi:hypothetical protein